MPYFELCLKPSGEVIDRVDTDNLEYARSFFIQRKQMDEATFDKLFDVKHSSK